MTYYRVHQTLRSRYSARRSSKDFKLFDTWDAAQSWADQQNAEIKSRRSKEKS